MAQKPRSTPSVLGGFGSLRGAFEKALGGLKLPSQPKLTPEPPQPKKERRQTGSESSALTPEYYVGQTGSPVSTKASPDNGTGANVALSDADGDDMAWLEMFESPPVGAGRSDFRVFDPPAGSKAPHRISPSELQKMDIPPHRTLNLHRADTRPNYDWRKGVDDAVTSFILEVKRGSDPNHKFVLIVTGRGQGEVRNFVETEVLRPLLGRGDIRQYVHFRDGAFKVQVS